MNTPGLELKNEISEELLSRGYVKDGDRFSLPPHQGVIDVAYSSSKVWIRVLGKDGATSSSAIAVHSMPEFLIILELLEVFAYGCHSAEPALDDD